MDQRIQELRRILTVDPDNNRARAELSGLLQRLGASLQQIIARNPDDLEAIGNFNELRFLTGEKFPAIRIYGNWIEVVKVEVYFDKHAEYVDDNMGSLTLQNGREFYFFDDPDGPANLIHSYDQLAENIIGNYSLYETPAEDGEEGYWEDEFGGYTVEEPGWYYYYDHLGGGPIGPYDTQVEVEEAFYAAGEDAFPPEFNPSDRDHLFNAEIILSQHKGLALEYDKYSRIEEPDEPEENDVNEEMMLWLEKIFTHEPDYFFLIPNIEEVNRAGPDAELPDWVWNYTD